MDAPTDPFEALPEDVGTVICSFLRGHETARACAASRSIALFASSPVVWASALAREFPHAPPFVLDARGAGAGVVTDALLERLPRLRVLLAGGCAEFTDAGAARLRRLHTLDMAGCSTVTPAAFAHLGGLQALRAVGCAAAATEEARRHLRAVPLLQLEPSPEDSDAD